MVRARWVALGIVSFFLVGIGFHLVQLYQLRDQIKISDLRLADWKFRELPPKLELELVLHNSGASSLVVDGLSYTILLEGNRIGSDAIRDLVIPAQGTGYIPIRISLGAGDLVKLIGSVISSGGFDLEAYGSALVPIKLFGIIRIFQIEIPYRFQKFISWRGELKIPTQLQLEPIPRNLQERSTYCFRGKLVVAGTSQGIPGAQIQILENDPVGDDLIAQDRTGSDGSFQICWWVENKEICTWIYCDRENEIYAKFPGTPEYALSRSEQQVVIISPR